MDKCPVGIGEVLHHLLAKIVLHKAGVQATEAWGNLNLRTGLETGIEGAIRSVHKQVEQLQATQPVMPMPKIVDTSATLEKTDEGTETAKIQQQLHNTLKDG